MIVSKEEVKKDISDIIKDIESDTNTVKTTERVDKALYKLKIETQLEQCWLRYSEHQFSGETIRRVLTAYHNRFLKGLVTRGVYAPNFNDQNHFNNLFTLGKMINKLEEMVESINPSKDYSYRDVMLFAKKEGLPREIIHQYLALSYETGEVPLEVPEPTTENISKFHLEPMISQFQEPVEPIKPSFRKRILSKAQEYGSRVKNYFKKPCPETD